MTRSKMQRLNRIMWCHAALVTLALCSASAWDALPTVADVTVLPGGTQSGTGLRAAPDWTPPTTDAVHGLAFDWLEARKVDPPTRRRAEQLWSDVPQDTTAADRLTVLSKTFALADPRAQRLVRFCSAPREGVQLPDVVWLTEPDVEPVFSANLRLVYGRWLIQESLFDEALVQFADLKPGDVVDPALLLFCQAVARHRLLQPEEGIKTIDQLLLGQAHCPRRYVALARLMREDLEGVTEDNLDHIARRMEDVERRLDLGRAGSKVRGIEDGVIESLDKLIKELEDQQQCQNPGNTLQPMKPADDSQLMGGLAPGRVTRKRLGGKSGWGNLPPKQREEALQEIGRRFPSHYRDVIEQYFRKMAAEEPQAK